MSEERDTAARQNKSNRKVAFACVALFGTMIGAAYAAVPLYDWFCRVTGFGGKTQVAEEAAQEVIDRVVTIRFDGNVNRGLPWDFKPEQRTITLKMGETGQLAYVAKNIGANTTVGTSTFNVTPYDAGAYFNKLDCFCFTEQPLEAGEQVEMPVVFFVDAEMNKDPNLKHIKEITLSYTFFPAHDAEQPVAARVDETATETNL